MIDLGKARRIPLEDRWPWTSPSAPPHTEDRRPDAVVEVSGAIDRHATKRGAIWFGCVSTVHVIRWMATQEWSLDEIRRALAAVGVRPHEGTVRAQAAKGRRGSASVPSLADAHRRSLERLRAAMGR